MLPLTFQNCMIELYVQEYDYMADAQCNTSTAPLPT